MLNFHLFLTSCLVFRRNNCRFSLNRSGLFCNHVFLVWVIAWTFISSRAQCTVKLSGLEFIFPLKPKCSWNSTIPNLQGSFIIIFKINVATLSHWSPLPIYYYKYILYSFFAITYIFVFVIMRKYKTIGTPRKGFVKIVPAVGQLVSARIDFIKRRWLIPLQCWD